jgi:septum formation protein
LKYEDIKYYIQEFKPLDKAGSYGIQEWIGLIAIKKITGSYTNVIGLPTQMLYKALINWGVSRD